LIEEKIKEIAQRAIAAQTEKGRHGVAQNN
jgi:hypothetical protein